MNKPLEQVAVCELFPALERELVLVGDCVACVSVEIGFEVRGLKSF